MKFIEVAYKINTVWDYTQLCNLFTCNLPFLDTFYVIYSEQCNCKPYCEGLRSTNAVRKIKNFNPPGVMPVPRPRMCLRIRTGYKFMMVKLKMKHINPLRTSTGLLEVAISMKTNKNQCYFCLVNVGVVYCSKENRGWDLEKSSKTTSPHIEHLNPPSFCSSETFD